MIVILRTTSLPTRSVALISHEILTRGRKNGVDSNRSIQRATTREIGGVGPDQVNLIVSDLIGVQQMLQAAVPTINNLSDLHTQVIINQLNEEIASIENANSPTGTWYWEQISDNLSGVRSTISIGTSSISLKANAGVQALFNPTPLPALNSAPAPFHDSADQTAFVTQWIQDSNHLGQMAQTIANNGFPGRHCRTGRATTDLQQ